MAAKDKPQPSEKKDPSIAALISLVCIVIGAPAAGYIYLGDMKKGIEYIIASWILWIVFAVGYFGVGILTGVGLCCFPVFIIPLAFDLVIVWDVYLQAKGEPTKLPVI